MQETCFQQQTRFPMTNEQAGSRQIGGLMVLLFALLILLCGAYLLRPSIRARYLFSELETLQLGHTTFEDAQRLAKKLMPSRPYTDPAIDRSTPGRRGLTTHNFLVGGEVPAMSLR